jgi:plastocyanin
MDRRDLLIGFLGAALATVPAHAAGKLHTIEIKAMAFGPSPAGLKVGDIIEWVNADIFRHTATARDKSFDVDLPPKARKRTVLKTAGAIAFYCRFHPGMTRTLAVAR